MPIRRKAKRKLSSSSVRDEPIVQPPSIHETRQQTSLKSQAHVQQSPLQERGNAAKRKLPSRSLRDEPIVRPSSIHETHQQTSLKSQTQVQQSPLQEHGNAAKRKLPSRALRDEPIVQPSSIHETHQQTSLKSQAQVQQSPLQEHGNAVIPRRTRTGNRRLTRLIDEQIEQLVSDILQVQVPEPSNQGHETHMALQLIHENGNPVPRTRKGKEGSNDLRNESTKQPPSRQETCQETPVEQPMVSSASQAQVQQPSNQGSETIRVHQSVQQNGNSASTSTQFVNANESSSSKKRTRGRGPTYMKEIWGRPNCLPLIEIQLDDKGLPISEKTQFSEFLGSLARNGSYCPLDIERWPTVVKNHCNEILDAVKKRFNLPPGLETWTLRSLGKKWRNWKAELKAAHYDPSVPLHEAKFHKDVRVQEEQWIKLWAYWGTDASEVQSKRNKVARDKKKMNHTTGKKPFAILRHKMTKELGRPPTRVEMFDKFYSHADGTPSSSLVAQNLTRMREKLSQLPPGEEDTLDRDDIFAQVLGRDKPGHVRLLCVNPTDVWEDVPSRSTCHRINIQQQEALSKMEEKLNQQEADIAELKKVVAAQQGRDNTPDSPIDHAAQEGGNDTPDSPIYLAAQQGRNNTPDCPRYPAAQQGRNNTPDHTRYLAAQQGRNNAPDSSRYLAAQQGRNNTPDSPTYPAAQQGRNNTPDNTRYLAVQQGRNNARDSPRYFPSLSKNVSGCSSITQAVRVGTRVLLKSLFDPTKVVAKGYLHSTNPSDKVGGHVLGPNWYEVYVRVAMEPDEQLIRPYGLQQTIQDALGEPVAWPRNLVVPSDDE